MAEQSDLRFLKPEIVAAQQLIQLSDEDNSISTGNGSSSKRNAKGRHEQEVEQTAISETTLAKIQEIFGKDEVYHRPRKQPKYRSLANIYKATAPFYEDGGFSGK